MANTQGTFLGYRNWLEGDDVTFETATAEQGDMVVGNLVVRESDNFWRIGEIDESNQSATVLATLTADQDADVITTQFPRGEYPGVSEAAPNFDPTDTIQYELLDENDVVVYDSGVIQSGVVVGYMTHYHELEETVTFRKIRATYDAISRTAAGFFDIGNLGVWSAVRPEVGFAYPAKFGWVTNKEAQRTPAGRLYTARFEPIRRWSLAFEALSNSDSLILNEMVRYAGGARQIFVRRGDLPVGRDAMLAVIAQDNDFDSVAHQLRSHTMSLEEFI